VLRNRPIGGLDAIFVALQGCCWPHLVAVDMLWLPNKPRLGRVAVVSSVGRESATMPHRVTRIPPDVPLPGLGTGGHFADSLASRDRVAKTLGLDPVIARPAPAILSSEAFDDRPHARDPNACGAIGRTFPLQDALRGCQGLISGREGFPRRGACGAAGARARRAEDEVNPPAPFEKPVIEAHFRRHELPRHPLVGEDFLRIGRGPRMRAVRAGGEARAGRWMQHPDSTDCGIHLGPGGRFPGTGQ